LPEVYEIEGEKRKKQDRRTTAIGRKGKTSPGGELHRGQKSQRGGGGMFRTSKIK